MAVIKAIMRTNDARIICGGDSLAKDIAGLVETKLSDNMSIPIVGTNIKDGNLANILEPFEEFDVCPTLRFVVKLEKTVLWKYQTVPQ